MAMLCGAATAANIRAGPREKTFDVLEKIDSVLDKELDVLIRENDGKADGAVVARFQSGAELCEGKEGFQMISDGDGQKQPKTLELAGDGSGFDPKDPKFTKWVLYCPKDADSGKYISGTAFADVYPGQDVVSKYVVDQKVTDGCPAETTLLKVNKCCRNPPNEEAGLILGDSHHTFVSNVKAGCAMLFKLQIKQGNLGKRWDWSKTELLEGDDDTEFNFNIRLFGKTNGMVINDEKKLTAAKPAAPETSRCGGVTSSSEEDGKENHDANPAECKEEAADAIEFDCEKDKYA